MVKLHRRLRLIKCLEVFMVECTHLIVNDYQIRVDGNFLDFQIIPFGNTFDNVIYIFFIGF